MLGQSPGDGAAEADMAPGLPLQGTHSPALHCLFETKQNTELRPEEAVMALTTRVRRFTSSKKKEEMRRWGGLSECIDEGK